MPVGGSRCPGCARPGKLVEPNAFLLARAKCCTVSTRGRLPATPSIPAGVAGRAIGECTLYDPE